MVRYCCVSVTFLDPVFHGKGDGDEPEWPPSPMRLFQALVAGGQAGRHDEDWSDAEVEAFRWLERRDPPEIIAPEAQRTSTYTLFVPNNDADKKFDRQDRLTSKVVRGHWLKEEGRGSEGSLRLHYLWAVADEEWEGAKRHVEQIGRKARHLLALGWGIDQAVGVGRVLAASELQSLVGVRWKPSRHPSPGGARLRVPKAGTLADLRRAHGEVMGRIRKVKRGRTTVLEYKPVRAARCFGTVTYLKDGMLPRRHVAMFELPEGVAFRQERACCVAAMVRSLVCRKQNRHDFHLRFPEDDPEVYLAGHVNGTGETPPRFSYLPLPTIGHAHADGMIRRVLIAEPFGGDGRRAAWVEHRLRGRALVDRHGNECGMLGELWRRRSREIINHYYLRPDGGAREWTSVTPVILPGFDRRGNIPAQRRNRLTKAECLFIKALSQAGLAEASVESFTLRKAPFWPGSQHPDQYRRPDYLDSKKNRRFAAWHVHLVFRHVLCGPIAVGAGRHFGLGLFAAWESK